jgi:hypothetical protein
VQTLGAVLIAVGAVVLLLGHHSVMARHYRRRGTPLQYYNPFSFAYLHFNRPEWVSLIAYLVTGIALLIIGDGLRT